MFNVLMRVEYLFLNVINNEKLEHITLKDGKLCVWLCNKMVLAIDQIDQCADTDALQSQLVCAELADVDNIDGMHKAVH